MLGTKKKLFLCFSSFPPQKTVKSSSDGRAHHRNRSGVVELVGRWEGALDHRESRERRDKIFAAKTENAIIFKKKLDQGNNLNFQWGIFIFLAARKLTFQVKINEVFV